MVELRYFEQLIRSHFSFIIIYTKYIKLDTLNGSKQVIYCNEHFIHTLHSDLMFFPVAP